MTDLRTALALKQLRTHGRIPLIVPPGINPREVHDRKGRPIPIYRKVWVDRDKYSRVKPMAGVAVPGQTGDVGPEDGPAFGQG